MTDDVSKLPAWPEALCSWDDEVPNEIEDFLRRDRDAYQARTEALVGRIKERELHMHREPCKLSPRWSTYPCECGLEALLAACERGTS